MNSHTNWKQRIALILLPWVLITPVIGQVEDDEEIYVLDPFEISPAESEGYVATTTLGGTRINTQLRDVGSAISVYTNQFLEDIGATDTESLLVYTTNTEIGTIQGNFSGGQDGASVNSNAAFDQPHTNTRVRGLAAADNTRNFFISDIPWDGYNVDRVELQRGPNAILFGLGSPAGIINTATKKAFFEDKGQVELRISSFGSFRATLDINRVLIEDELAIRVAAVDDKENYQQNPAHEDDSRVYIHARWEPKFLNTDTMKTTIQAHYETGEIRANRPRIVPVGDNITPWFRPVYQNGNWSDAANFRPTSKFNPEGGAGMLTFTPFELQDNNLSAPGSGVQRASIAGPEFFFDPENPDGTPENPDGIPNDLYNKANPWYIPALGNYAQVFGGPIAIYGDSGSNIPTGNFIVTEFFNPGGLGPDGTPDAEIAGLTFARMGSIANYTQFVRNATVYPDPTIAYEFPYESLGQYKNQVLTDPSVFDFYNQLIDGPNKMEYEDWDARNFSIDQNFFDAHLGYEFAWDSQDYTWGRESLIDFNQNLFIDINETYTDGTPNPNVGRPFVSDSGQGGNHRSFREREVKRLTAFGMFDFNDINDESWITRILGKHILTGLGVTEESYDKRRFYQRYITDDKYINEVTSNTVADRRLTDGKNIPNVSIYLGPSLLNHNVPNGAGANIPNPKYAINMPDNYPVRFYDDTWNAPGVDPAALWYDPRSQADPNNPDDDWSTQSENPANYVGWRTTNMNIYSSDPFGDLDPFTTGNGSQATKYKVDSEALVLQSHWWDGALVTTYGWREDKLYTWAERAPELIENGEWRGRYDMNDPALRLNGPHSGYQDGQSQSFSVALHLNEILPNDDWLPLEVSLYYNESENFQPGSGRVDAFGVELPPPSGSTEDRSILLATKDGKYSLKITDYETSVKYQSSSYLGGTWFVSRVIKRGVDWANIFEYDVNASGPNNPTGENTYSPDGDQTQEEADALEARHIAAWRQLEEDIRDLSERRTGNPEAFYDAWAITVDSDPTIYRGVTSRDAPPGFAYTQDSFSQGQEFEFTAQPIENWRISINASKTEAKRKNLGGEALSEYVDLINTAMDGDAGDLRIWWGSPTSDTLENQWNATFRGQWELTRLQENSFNPEIRKWRYNIVTNYDFTEGTLAGFNVGAGYRWQDNTVIGYRIQEDPVTGEAGFILDNPYPGPSEDNFDLWVGYNTKLTDKIDWRIQLNVYNVGDDERLIPLTTQPDGTPAGYRIAPTQIWRLTSTFSF
ncbi:MAG: TonB-dependent receptor plug domain-containing protein [Verrucomicrobiae bacterium]|nr:TonB-dependent receptor plug domain-containing protein [Verrucomicrobiae bacterium]